MTLFFSAGGQVFPGLDVLYPKLFHQPSTDEHLDFFEYASVLFLKFKVIPYNPHFEQYKNRSGGIDLS